MLTDEEFRRFGSDGYLVLPCVIPEDLLAAADAEVDAVVDADPPPPGAVQRGPHALLPVSGHTGLLDPPVELAEPRPVLARRGDLLLAHFLLGHNTGGNVSDHVRRVLYYRLSCLGHRDRWQETFLDVLAEHAPVRRRMTA